MITGAGVYSDRLAAMTGGAASPRIVPFRGRYYALVPEASNLVHGLVYPVPDPAFPFLGVSFTRSRSPARCGPGPTPSLPSRARDTSRARSLYATSGIPSPTAASVASRVATGAPDSGELRGDLSQRAFVAALQRLVPGVRPQHLAGTHSGIRAQALDDDGRLVDDFRFDYAENVVHVRNAPSPGATSSLAIVSHMLDAVAISLLRSKRPRCPMPQVAFTLGVNKAEDLHDCGEVGTDSWGLTVTALRNELGGHEEGTSWGSTAGLASGRSPSASLAQPLGTEAGRPLCRFCEAPLNLTVVDLGMSPLCESFVAADQHQKHGAVLPAARFAVRAVPSRPARGVCRRRTRSSPSTPTSRRTRPPGSSTRGSTSR